DLVGQRVGFRVGAVGAQVVPDAVAQRSRFADVDGVAIRVEVQIDSGLLRQPGDLFLEFLNRHTLLCRVFRQCLNPRLYVTASAATWGSRRHLSKTARPETATSRRG